MGITRCERPAGCPTLALMESTSDNSPAGARPDVSVVVATRDRAGRLAELLSSLRRQTLDPRRYEVVVVDDGSRDDTPLLLEREAAAGDLHLSFWSRAEPGGPAAARNEAWRSARAELVAFVDDDCVADPAWLERLLNAARDAPRSIVQGRVDPRADESRLDGPFSRTIRVQSLGPWFQTCNVAYPKSLLERLGGFDEAFRTGEDTDLAWRAIEDGAKAIYAPNAQVFHAVARLGPVGKLRVATLWTSSIRLFALHPQLRDNLTFGVFWKGSHYLLVRALLALVLPRSLWPVRRWLAYAYLVHLVRRGRIDGGGPLIAPYLVVHDVVELVAVARGAARYRTFVL